MKSIEKIQSIKSGSYIIVCDDNRVIKNVKNDLVKKYNIKYENINDIEPTKNTIGIKEVKGVIRKLLFKSGKDYSLFSILNAQLMTREAANSLLKTIEEPSGNLIILIFVDNISNLLSTIISRCKKIIIRSELEISTNNRYIDYLKAILDKKHIYEKIAIVDNIVKNDVNITIMLRSWIWYLNSNPVIRMDKIMTVDSFLRIYNNSLNKKLFLENLVIYL